MQTLFHKNTERLSAPRLVWWYTAGKPFRRDGYLHPPAVHQVLHYPRPCEGLTGRAAIKAAPTEEPDSPCT